MNQIVKWREICLEIALKSFNDVNHKGSPCLSQWLMGGYAMNKESSFQLMPHFSVKENQKLNLKELACSGLANDIFLKPRSVSKNGQFLTPEAMISGILRREDSVRCAASGGDMKATVR